MRIAMVGTGYAPAIADGKRSVETSIYLLANELAVRGHSVIVLDIPYTHPRGADNLTFHEVWSPSAPYAVKVLSFATRVFETLRKGVIKTDVIQTYSQFPTIAAVMAQRVTKHKALVFRVACSPYLMMPPNPINLLGHTIMERWALRHADRVVVHTGSGIRDIVRRYGILADKVVAIPAGVDMGLVNGWHPSKNRPVIFYPAVITPRKNQMAIVLAAPMILSRHPNCRFVFAGPIEDAKYYQKLQKAAQGFGIADRIEILGRVSREEVFKWYSRAVMMVFPSLFEMQGIVLVEAMACGLPVVAYDIDVVRDVAGQDGVHLIRPGSCESLAKGILDLLENRERRDWLSQHGKEIAGRYSWSRIVEDFEREYHNVSVNQE